MPLKISTTGGKSITIKYLGELELIQSIQTDPFNGIGKPEPLRHNYSGMWSRRINREHRMIYEIADGNIIIHALKEHY